MATLSQIYNLAEAVESGSKQALSSSVASISLPRSQDIGSTPEVNLKFMPSKPSGHLQMMYDVSGSLSNVRHDTWEGTLTAFIKTERTTNNSYHNSYISSVRRVLSDRGQINKHLPIHQILYVEESGVNVEFDNETNQDQTIISYTITVCVRPNQWPVEEQLT